MKSEKDKTFSERIGIVKNDIIQKDDVDYDTRIGIYNVIFQTLIHDISAYRKAKHVEWKTKTYPKNKYELDEKALANKDFEFIEKRLWLEAMKYPIDLQPREMKYFAQSIREYLTSCKWYEVYELIEHILKNYNWTNKKEFIDRINMKLDEEKSAYRIIYDEIAMLTNENEIEEVEEVLSKSEGVFYGVNAHLKSALQLLSDRKNPNYRKSIDESIMAVESICVLICQNDKATLGKALNKIERDGKIKISGTLKSAYSQIYGYTSDNDGIRHAMTQESTLNYEDAKYMLVSCTCFVNYLIVKAEKAGVFSESEAGEDDE